MASTILLADDSITIQKVVELTFSDATLGGAGTANANFSVFLPSHAKQRITWHTQRPTLSLQ